MTDNSDFEKIVQFDNLYKGLQKAKCGVMWKNSVAGYDMNALKNTLKLQKELKDKMYCISEYQIFHIYEPKEREIVATRIRDRQFQRSLCDNVLYPQLTKGFIYDNCACLKNKGVTFALDRLETHLHRHYRKYGATGWVLKCDIHHYFPDTPHNVAKAAIRKRIKDPDIIKAVDDIIDSFEGDKGIGLGSQVSQLIELAVLDEIDHFIKERLHIKAYVRYMDDFILIHPDRKVLEHSFEVIKNKIKELGLELNKSSQLFPLRNGIVFLKWHFYLTSTGKVIRKMNPKNITKERKKLQKLTQKIKTGQLPEDYLWTSFQSWRAHARLGDCKAEIYRMTKLYYQLKEEIRMEIMVGLEKRMIEATARAEAAASKCEKLAELLELKLAETETETDSLERLDAQDDAILELAELIGGDK